MTVFEAAQKIAQKGMLDRMVFKFYDNMHKDVMEYVELFSNFGVSQNDVWEQYERWQEV